MTDITGDVSKLELIGPCPDCGTHYQETPPQSAVQLAYVNETLGASLDTTCPICDERLSFTVFSGSHKLHPIYRCSVNLNPPAYTPLKLKFTPDREING